MPIDENDKKVSLGIIGGILVFFIIITWLIISPISFFSIAFLVGLFYLFKYRKDKERKQKEAINDLNLTRELLKGDDLKSDKKHVKMYLEAVDLFNKRDYVNSSKLAKKSYKLKQDAIEAEKLRKQIEKERRKELVFEKAQIAKGLIKHKDRWGTHEEVRKWKEIETGLNNNFASLSPYQFEKFIAELFNRMGYSTTRTPSTGDFGADIIAKRKDEIVLIECKKYSEGNLVTPKEVQRTLGAMWKYKAKKAVFVTTSDFTVRAKEVEKDGPIELWNKRILYEMVIKYFINNGKPTAKSSIETYYKVS